MEILRLKFAMYKYELAVRIFFCAKRDTLRCTNYITTLENLIIKCLLLCTQVPNFTFFSYILNCQDRKKQDFGNGYF